jgi:putative aminopeptidase FrvX
MYIRLDEEVRTREDTLRLGINNGDFVSIDPKFTATPSGFIKTRFLDDKASVFLLLSLINHLKANNITPKHTLQIIFSTYEEVGHGASSIPDLDEMLAVDMGCIGDDLSCTEYDVSICAKDGSGPYDYEMTNRLINLAKENRISYAVDIYPYYSSDVSAALRGGNDIKGALIGAGIHASHGMERTHQKGLKATLELLYLYITK